MAIQSAEAFDPHISSKPAVKPSKTADPYFLRNLRYTSAFDNAGRLRFACFTAGKED